MAEPSKQDFTLYRGVKRVLRLTMTANGSVAGWTTRFSVRRASTAEDPLLLDLAGTISDAGSPTTPGVFLVTITKAESLTLDAAIHVFSFERTDVGSENLLTIGKMTVKNDVRNAAAS